MRMWMVNPEILCRQHLLGEHLETHMFLTVIKEGKNLDGYIKGNLLEAESLFGRHMVLSNEMISRGYNHKSPMADFVVPFKYKDSKVDDEKSLLELLSRCSECKKRYEELIK